MLILCFSFFWVSVTMMESLVFYGFQIKMTNVGNFLSYHIVTVASLVNTSNVALTLNKTITIPQTLDNNVVYGFKVVRSGGFSVIELYTISTLYSYNIVIPKVQVNVTLPQTVVLNPLSGINPQRHSSIIIEVIRTSSGVTTVNLI
jgi:hypothetical protein